MWLLLVNQNNSAVAWIPPPTETETLVPSLGGAEDTTFLGTDRFLRLERSSKEATWLKPSSQEICGLESKE